MVIGDSPVDHYETISAYQSLEELLSPELYARSEGPYLPGRDGEGTPTLLPCPWRTLPSEKRQASSWIPTTWPSYRALPIKKLPFK
ncbi:MAG: hypothetical protein ACLR0U_32725 [Enterocloster clostridioformis]